MQVLHGGVPPLGLIVYFLLVSLLIQGGKDVIFLKSKKIQMVFILAELIIIRSIKPVPEDEMF